MVPCYIAQPAGSAVSPKPTGTPWAAGRILYTNYYNDNSNNSMYAYID